MSSRTVQKAEVLLVDLQRIFGARLRALVAYGEQGESEAVNCLALVESVEAADLDACARAVQRWHREGLATPLVLPEREFRRSLDAFPLEYSEIARAHVRVYGDDPFDGLAIAGEDLRRALETQVKSHLLHLREEYIEAAGHPRAIGELVRLSATAFASLLRGVARLQGVAAADRGAATREGARLASLPADIVTAVLALEHPSDVASTDPARLFPQYLVAVEQLAAFVDSWRAA